MPSALKKTKQRNYLSRNLQALSRRSSQMVAYLENEPRLADVQAVDTRSGQLSLNYSRGSKSIHLHSTYDPHAEALAWCRHVGRQDWQIGVIFGLGLGYHVEELARQYPERMLIVVEPNTDVLKVGLQMRDLRQLLSNPRFVLVTGTDPHATASMVFEQNLRHEVLKGKVAFLEWPAYRRLWSDFWGSLQRNIGDLAQQTHVNLSTYKYFSLMWQENFFTNLRASAADPSVTSLFSLFEGKPAILVSAGPSLQKNIHLLKEAREHALIIAAGSAVGPLMAHGIKPHFVVSYDAAPSNYYVFSNLDTSQTILLYSAVIYPRILAEYKGQRLAMGVDVYPYERWFFEKLGLNRGTIASGPSVANLTWDLIHQMGCDPIVFVGQDLAYGVDGSAHAEGRSGLEFEAQTQSDESEESLYDKTAIWTQDIWGNQVRTRAVWLAMKIWFEQHIRAAGNDGTFIDATEGGVRIEGTQIMTLRDVLDQYCTSP
ncbi:MAG: motility associated factor glycosyltransferase family protein, partial [Caldilineaceae bacterium]|nr:motility associated factor glycosyltransferase family protein [Caldilineaceae bacterium]